MNIVDRLPEDLPPDGVRDVLRKVTDEDQIVAEENDTLTYSAHKFSESRIRERQLDMKLVDVEVLFDRSKLVFYFTAIRKVLAESPAKAEAEGEAAGARAEAVFAADAEMEAL